MTIHDILLDLSAKLQYYKDFEVQIDEKLKSGVFRNRKEKYDLHVQKKVIHEDYEFYKRMKKELLDILKW